MSTAVSESLVSVRMPDGFAFELSKSEELRILSDFVAQLPAGSYVRGILAGLEPEIERAVRSDFCAVEFDATSRIVELRAEVRGLEEQAKRLRERMASQLEEREREERKIRDGLEELKERREELRILQSEAKHNVSALLRLIPHLRECANQ